jgi:O-acetyl-ADP-ribose deacetylase (regulator of RNase III)
MTIHYKTGDLFANIKPWDVLLHVVNNIDRMGSGFVVPLMKHYPDVPKAYHWWPKRGKMQKPEDMKSYEVGHANELGSIQIVTCVLDDGEPIWVVNMVAQDGVVCPANPHPLNYSALKRCLEHVRDNLGYDRSRHIGPKFGAGLAGGQWDLIAEIIKETLYDRDLTIYTLE